MTREGELTDVWSTKIKPQFDAQMLEEMVMLRDGSHVRYVNLDNAATTKPFASVLNMIPDFFGSYGSIHRGSGQHSKITTLKYEEAREKIRRFVGASDNNYAVFSGNTTGAVNHLAALLGSFPGKVLVSDIEHSSNLLPWVKHGEIVQFPTGTHGEFSLPDVENYFRQHEGNIKLLAVTGQSNVTGYQPPINDLAQLAHQYGSKIFVDVCQLIPHQKVDVRPDGDPEHLDFIAFSSHKMYAPVGVGVLVGSKKFFDSVMPYQIGGGNLSYIAADLSIVKTSTVRTHDPGTANAVGVVTLGEAMRQLEALDMEFVQQYEHELVASVFERMKDMKRVTLYIPELYGTVIPFDVEGFPAGLVVEVLAQDFGIGLRKGAFCTYELIRKLKGVSREEDHLIAEEVKTGITSRIPSIVRASFSIYNRPEDGERFVDALGEITQKGFDFYRSFYLCDEKTGDWSARFI